MDKLISQAELAERAGLTEGSLSRLERGARKARFHTLRKLAAALEVDAHDLIDQEPVASAAD